MKKNAWLLIALILLFMFVAVSHGIAAPKKTIGVQEFENHTAYRELAAAATDTFNVELAKNPKFNVVERVRLDKLIDEQTLGKSGLVSKRNAASIGKINGLNYIIVGTVSDAKITKSDHLLWMEGRASVVVAIRIIDATTGSVLLADSVEGVVTKSYGDNRYGHVVWGEKLTTAALVDATQKAAAQLAVKLNNAIPTTALSGYVVQKTGSTIYIDLGSEKGVTVGQQFLIVREGEPITHPATGEVLGTEKTDLAIIEITNVEAKMSSGDIVTKKGDEAVSIGDRVYRQ